MPLFRDDTLARYLDAAASGEPVPGGGSVAALAGALAAAMASMVAAFTLSSKRCAPAHEEAAQCRDATEELRLHLLDLVDRDAEAYAAVAAAFRLPKGNDSEREARSAAIRAASAAALAPPLSAARACRQIAVLLPRLAEIGNPNLLSDAGVAAFLAEAAFECAVLNVRINLKGLDDAARGAGLEEEFAAAREEIAEARARVRMRVEAALQR